MASGSSLFVAGNFNSYRGVKLFRLAKLDTATGDLDANFLRDSRCNSCGSNLDSLTLTGSRLYVGGDNATLYQGVPAYGAFPVDTSTGAPSDP